MPRVYATRPISGMSGLYIKPRGCVGVFVLLYSVPPSLHCCCCPVEMHSPTFVLFLVALFTVLSVAHPITHLGHRNIEVKVRAHKRACKPPIVVNSDTPPTSTPVPIPGGIPSDAESDSEPSSIKKPSLIAVPSSSPAPTSTKDDDEDGKPTPTPSTGGGSSLTNKLFPYGFGEDFWTTSEGIDGARPLSDATLKPTKVLTALSRDIVKAPDGKLGMKAHYPQGSYTFTHKPLGGFSFYAKGPSDVDLSTALEATFGYSVFFEKDFDYQLGGKLLGFCE